MLKDARKLQEGEVLEADVCIAGGGAAGITIARALRDSGLQVLLLEAGGGEPNDKHQALYKGEYEGVGSMTLDGHRVRAWGGSTNWWAGWCRPLEPEDFEARDWMPGSGWPFGLDELMPYYQRALEDIQIGAFEWDAPAVADRVGHTLPSFREEGAKTVYYQYSPPTRFGDRYKSELVDAESVEVYLHANVSNIELSSGGGEVKGFACKTLEGNSFRATADQYVVAMGGIETPRMLLASNDVQKNGIGNEHDHLGRNFMEHPHVYGGAYIVTKSPEALKDFPPKTDVQTVDEQHPEGKQARIRYALAVSREAREAEQIGSLAATVKKVDPSKKSGSTGPLGPGKLFDSVLSGGEKHMYSLDIRAEQRPLENSRITLTDEEDALGIPKLRLEWRASEFDMTSIKRNLQYIGAELGRLGIGRIWMPLDEEGRYTPPDIRGGCHHMGTTRMSEAPEDGVVDPECRVHGVDNLFVGGSSVFPTAGFANPTFTIVALARRIADTIVGESPTDDT